MNEKKDLLYIKIFTGFIVLVLCVIILKALKTVFVPFFMAILLYFFFNRAVNKLQSWKIPQAIVLLFLLVFIFILFYLFGLLVYSGVSVFIDKFPEYSAKFTELITGLLVKLKIPLKDVEKYLQGLDLKKAIDTSKITSIISTTFGEFGAFFGNLVMMLLFSMFMLAGRKGLAGRINKAFEQDRSEKIAYVIDSIEKQVQHYLLIKTSICCLTGIVAGVILVIGGIDFAVFSALLIFALNFIPSIGSVIATIFPVLIGLLQYGFSVRVILVTLSLMATQFVIGNVLEPKLAGKSLNLSPIIILMSLIFWGYVWGIVGMIMAVPLTSALKIIFQHIEILEPISDLISAE
jgi:predicted PurR-regulated permease PerM